MLALARDPNPEAALIIDCHTHLNRYTPEHPTTLDERYAALKAQMEAYGIDHALVISSYDESPDRPSAEAVLKVVESDSRLGLIAAPTAGEVINSDFARLRELLRSGHTRGLKLYPGYLSFHVWEPRLRGMYEMAAEFGVPVMIHTGDTFARRAKVRFAHPLEVDDVAVDFPEVTFVLAHLGNPWFIDAAEVVYKNANVLADLSGLTLGEFQPRYAAFARAKVNEAIAYVNDPEKLMFGTDWPISDVGTYLEWVRSLDLTPDEVEGVMWRNADRVFGLGLGGGDGGG